MSLGQSIKNLLVKLPLRLKARLAISNNFTKLFGLHLCCGNNGQPGC